MEAWDLEQHDPIIEFENLPEGTRAERFETQRLVIRRFRADDWQDLHEYLSQPIVVKYEPYGTGQYYVTNT